MDEPTSMQSRVWEEPIYGGWDEPDAVEVRLCTSDQDGVRTWLVVERYAVCWLPGRITGAVWSPFWGRMVPDYGSYSGQSLRGRWLDD